MDDKDIVLGGAIDGNLGEQDYAGDLPSNIPTPTETFLDNKTQYSQTRSTCVLYGSIGCVGDNTSYDFTREDIANIESLAPEYGRSVEHGMYLTKGADCVVDYLSTKGVEIIKGTVGTYTQDFYDIMDMGYSVLFGSQISKSYITDLNADGDIDISFNPGQGHARRMFKHKDNGNYYIVENFLGRLKYNVIEVTPGTLDMLLKNKDLFNQSFYFYMANMENTNYPAHKEGVTPQEKEIVKAWKQIIDQGFVPKMVYTDDYCFNTMKTDVNLFRHGVK